MTEDPKKKTTSKATRLALPRAPTGLHVHALQLIELEIKGGSSSMLLAFAGSNHLNDFLHTAGLITDDCWNAVKGTANLFASVENIKVIAGAAGSVLSTLVESGTKATKGMATVAATKKAKA